MATNSTPNNASAPPCNSYDLPPPYAAVVGNHQYGFVAPSGESFPPAEGGFVRPKQFTSTGVYPHPDVAILPTHAGDVPPPLGMQLPVGAVGVVMPPAVGSEPTTITCNNCGKVVTTRVTYTTAWHTHLVAGTICMLTMVCSLCCLGLVPYCFDSFKDAEHYCPNCSTYIGKNNRC